MTREEAIAVFRGFKLLPREMEAVDMAIKALEQEPCEGAIQALEQQRWHPISEEPPKKDEDYIITYKWIGSCSGDIYKEVVVSRYYGDGKWDVGNHEVLAWKPLPQPYKA